MLLHNETYFDHLWIEYNKKHEVNEIEGELGKNTSPFTCTKMYT